MQKHATKYYTPDEYLALEEVAEYRSEYYNRVEFKNREKNDSPKPSL